MAFIPWPNGVQLCFDFTTAGQNWQFCVALRKSAGAPSDADLIMIANEAVNHWTSPLKTFIVATSTLRQIRVTNMTAQGAAQYVLPVNEAGTGAGNSAPLGSCVVASLRTAKRGRSYRGRAYLSGWNVANLSTPTTILAALVTAWTAFWTGLITSLDALGFDVVVASRQHNGAVTSPAELNEVISVVVDSAVDSQRRRLAGRGT